MRSHMDIARYNGGVPGGAGNTIRGLTHSSDSSREGLAVDATQLPEARKPQEPIIIPDRVALRALRKFSVDESGCHLSTYSVGSHGYAQIGWHDHERGRRVMITAHRAAWSAVFGQIPEGMTIDHTCKNRRCVNVSHLRLLSNFENARRTFGRDWPLGTCINGHSNDLLELVSGTWQCSICSDQWQRDYQARKATA